ncbi:MAG: DNA polymerase III subunit delta [Proteobacteria bacterium]|nr:DNA polymerase III subunit delta [Pseudomonadota bacterium]
MKLTGARVDSFIRRPDPAARAVLVYGRDGGLVRERADALARGVVPDLGDPFRVSELTPAQLSDDPARLADEAAALSFTGGRRVVRVRPITDALAELFQRFLAAPAGDALVVVEAGDLAKRSRLRLLFEQAANAAAVPCYPDDGVRLRRLIEETLAGPGFSIEPEALDFLESTLGGDRLATRAELEKLTTYMGSERRITLAEVAACVGDSSIITLDGVAFAAAAGDLARLERTLARAYLEGAAPVALLRAMARHLQRLHRAAGLVARGDSADAAMASLRPRPHFSVADAFKRQLTQWSVGRLVGAMEIVLTTEIACKTTGTPAALVCSRALMRIARAARRADTAP